MLLKWILCSFGLTSRNNNKEKPGQELQASTTWKLITALVVQRTKVSLVDCSLDLVGMLIRKSKLNQACVTGIEKAHSLSPAVL